MKIWSKQLLIKPDPAPYLMASRSVRLLAAPGTSLLWPSTPQLLSDTLSKKTVGQNPFEFSFSVHSSSIGAGTVYLLEMPGLLNVKAEDGTLMFSFGWKSGWYAVPASVLVDGWNEVALSGDGVAEIKLTVNTSQFTIFGTGTSAEPYPTITTGQLDVKNNWLKLKDVNAILVGVAPDPEPQPEPEPDTPKKWYPSTGTGGAVWTPDDVVKPNDPVYDTESNATTNNGSTGKVDTVVSVRPDGSGFTGSSGTDYTDTYTPPDPDPEPGPDTPSIEAYEWGSFFNGKVNVYAKTNFTPASLDFTPKSNTLYSDKECTIVSKRKLNKDGFTGTYANKFNSSDISGGHIYSIGLNAPTDLLQEYTSGYPGAGIFVYQLPDGTRIYPARSSSVGSVYSTVPSIVQYYKPGQYPAAETIAENDLPDGYAYYRKADTIPEGETSSMTPQVFVLNKNGEITKAVFVGFALICTQGGK